MNTESAAQAGGRPRVILARRLLVGAAVLSWIATFLLSIHIGREFERSADLVEHTFLVRSAIAELVATLDQAESSERGYVLTGDSEYSQAFGTALQSAPAQVERLRNLTLDDVSQQRRVARVAPAVTARLSELRQAIEVRQTSGEAAAVAIVRANVAGQTMTSVNRQLSALSSAERTLLAARRRYEHYYASFLLVSLVLASLALGLSVTAAVVWARAAAVRRKSAESNAARLRAENEALAERQRTAEFQERFIAILGHDLRNPLSSIVMGLRGLRMSPPAKQSMLIDRLERSTGRMTRMVEQLIDLARSRLGSGIPVEPGSADLGVIAADVTDEARLSHPERLVAIETRGDLHGHWDSDRLAQVVSNLVENALRHGAADAPVSIRIEGTERAVSLAVHNTGPTIPSALLRALFDPFRSGEGQARTSRASGLGLGLYISHQIVSAHRGTIDVRSSEVEGTTFTVEVPRLVAPGGG